MQHKDNTARALPDVARDGKPALGAPLDWVGMSNIDAVIVLADRGGDTLRVPARVDAYVDLARPDRRGIHMSRLYLEVERALGAEALTPCAIRRLLREFLASHEDLSGRAMVRIGFDLLLRRRALKSDNAGWKSYPLHLTGTMQHGHFALELECEVVYSSTCPCSAALARQLIQERFDADFPRGQPLDHAAVMAWLGSEHGICATPHSQRSVASVRMKLAPSFGFAFEELIDRVEDALQTPVQTAVKREDEQAFAQLNGANPMFCEDAARRIHAALDADERIADFHVRATHMESLHAHDAVAVVTKGIEGGYSAAS